LYNNDFSWSFARYLKTCLSEKLKSFSERFPTKFKSAQIEKDRKAQTIPRHILIITKEHPTALEYLRNNVRSGTSNTTTHNMGPVPIKL